MSALGNQAKISKKQTIETLLAIKCIFDDFGIPFVLMGGLVLGYARYKDIMDWDTGDIDMGVFVPVADEIKKKWPDIIKKKTVQIPISPTVMKRVAFHNGYKGFKIHNGMSITIKFWNHVGEYFESVTTDGTCIEREHERWFLNPQPVEFLGTTFLIPDKVEDFLNNHYGKDWKTNIIPDVREWLAEFDRHREQYPYPIRIRIKPKKTWRKTLVFG